MTTFSRTDTSIVGHWWWTVDRWTLAAVLMLMAFGTMLTLASSPSIAISYNYDSLHFVKRHLVYLPLSATIIIIVSMMTPLQIRRLALVAFGLCLIGLVITLVLGVEVKGSRRWLKFAGLSLQVSEFAKPTFAVVTAWLFAQRIRGTNFPGYTISAVSFLILIALVLKQPDFGQTAVISLVWMAQLFLTGLPIWIVTVLIVLAVAGLFAAFETLPHVRERILNFINPESADRYQIERSIESFKNGGLFGQGPGEGIVKNHLPDAHSDFVFAVAGEELGLILTLVIIILFAFIVMRGMVKAMSENNLFILLAVSGLLVQFGLQALINMASNLDLIPTKGMTLPFISYGGSSLLAIAFGIGMLLALTRRRIGKVEGA